MRKALLVIFGLSVGVACFLATMWAAGALYFDLPIAWLCQPLALIYALAMMVGVFSVRSWWRALGVVMGGFVAVLAWWLTIKPGGDKPWQPDVERRAWADIRGDDITLHDVRNCDYRTETDYTPSWETRVVHLSKLTGVDLSITYWGSPWIAHPIASFQFSDSLPVAISIEARKTTGQGYSVIAGLYRQYELIYIVADERDVIRLRTNYREGEDVHLYRIAITPEHARSLFLAYLDRLNRLHERPEFYNQVVDNCTTNIRVANMEATKGKVPPWNWRMLLNGKSDELLYERGLINRSVPLATLKERSLINKRARAAGASADFSQLIRVDLPAAPPPP